jgi:hypothetical protein
MPKTTDMHGKTLYFEMRTHPPDKSKIFFTQGIEKMTAVGDCINISWPDLPGAHSFKSVTLRPEFVANIEPNSTGKTFEILGTSLKPDFIYIEKY